MLENLLNFIVDLGSWSLWKALVKMAVDEI